jgi:hypothetical protein
MNFVYQVHHEVLKGKHIYRRTDYAFDFLPASKEELGRLIGRSGTASVSIHELQLEMDVETGRLLYAWGYCPWFTWRETNLTLGKQVVDGAVFVLGHDLDTGEHRHIPPVEGDWRIMYSCSSGWVAAVSTKEIETDALVRISDGCILGFKGSDLNMLWIHPETEDS